MTEQTNIARILKQLGIDSLNTMQQQVLDAGVTGDMLLLSPTGSGKTLAFLLPLLQTLNSSNNQVQVLIVAPSRELALQIETVFRAMGSGFTVYCCYGGHPIRTEKKRLENPPAVLIGTPGRIVDHLERGNVSLDRVQTLILDEFDKSLELGFLDEMEYIVSHLPALRRRVLTSATEGVEIPEFIGIRSPKRLSFLDSVKTNKGLALRVVKSPEKDKLETLYGLLGELNGESALIFCNYRETVERVSDYLTDNGVDNDFFHGGMEQPERERALSHFRNGSASVFISTDLAARGLDIPDVQHVIHYHLPVNEEAYVHRNGRTARMHAEGTAYLLLHAEEFLPEYIAREPDEFFLPEKRKAPQRSEWVTLTINRGKRDKLSKKDVVGFLFQKGGLAKDELGVVEIKESCAYAAVKREAVAGLLERVRDEKIKNMKAKFS